jgi:hypothetical protein
VTRNQRHVRRFVQALLALILLACMPALGYDQIQSIWVAELSDGADTIGAADDDGDPPGIAGSGGASASTASWLEGPEATLRLLKAISIRGLPFREDIERATGPPAI